MSSDGLAGSRPVESDVICAITRFGLRSPTHLVETYLDYRRVVAEARDVPGLLRAAFLIEDARTAYSVSVWSDRGSGIPLFGTRAHAHVRAGNHVMGRLKFDPARGPELWSTKWRLVAVSNNLNWGDLDLRAHVRESK